MANTNIVLKHGDQLTVTVQDDPVTPQPNRPPLVSTGVDMEIKLPVSSMALVGQSSDPDNDVLTYAWTKTAGPSTFKIVSPTLLTTQVTGMTEPGTYTFKLTVSDGKGGTASDDMNIVVKPADVVIPPQPGTVDYLKLPAYNDGAFKSDQVITRKSFIGSPKVAANLVGLRNLKFIECFFHKSVEEHISFENSNGILVDRCLMGIADSGLYALNSSDITMRDCQVFNMRQRSGGSRGQMFQANSSSDVLIENCRSEGFDGESTYEDHISFYASNNCTARGNLLRGGGPSDSGSGMILGDNGGSNQLSENNKLFRTGNAGIGVAGGSNIRVLNNDMYSERTAVSNNPLYVWSQANAGGNGVTVKGNRSYWIHKTGYDNSGGWNAGNIPNTSFETPAKLTLSQMAFPDVIIDFVTPAELLTIRK